MKVKNLIEQFEDFKVIAGKGGLERNISTVSVMDAPDIYNWMKGGEFLITTAYIMKGDPLELKDLVIKLDKNGASALGLKLGRFIMELPLEVKETADKLNFPIIYIPVSYAFTDVINPVLASIVNTQAKKLEMSEKIHKCFTQIVIEGKGTTDIVDMLYGILDKDLVFIDLVSNKTYIRGNSEDFQKDIRKKLLDKYYKYPVQTGSSIYGYIIIKDNKLEGLDKRTIEHASTVLKLNIQKEISNRQIEQKYKDEFIQDLILNNIRTVEEANNRASLYGWKMDKGLSCLIVDIDDFKEQFISLKGTKCLEEEKKNLFNLAKDVIKKNLYKYYYTTYSDSIVFLVEPDLKSKDEFFKKLQNISKRIREKVSSYSDFTVTVGIGSYKESILDVYISFVEAQKAVRIGRTIYGNNYTHVYSELGIYKMLYDLSLKEDSSIFCNKYLDELIKYDVENNGEYMKTLDCLIKNDWNLKQTSEELFIHYNTMKYRFNKICNLVNLELNDGENKFIIELCLKLMKMKQQYSLYMKTNI